MFLLLNERNIEWTRFLGLLMDGLGGDYVVRERNTSTFFLFLQGDTIPAQMTRDGQNIQKHSSNRQVK